ncbi:hypothetical protein QBC34DRAFT_404729 [Podospora aff. communis PSN243]|uniref:Ubiquitin carboxyl-terminal hydrolase n=1 Tax=Podospora aff. communis PSN243 TaxID=3040156 RepID=A0AAV9GN34_9PEZI|nr:hypothetical protein QBC34DRAFT_404729 [Podospora aff. communis PSN243]
MPDRTLTVATYAAGASLAAITLIYVFAPTYFIDNAQSSASSGIFGSKKQGVVGLSNPANDCFINSVLQALAGLKDLRLYLIQETHRRSLDDGRVYARVVLVGASDVGSTDDFAGRKDLPEWKIEGLQAAIVSRGLKDILDALNERPIYKKTISAGPFVRTLELAFRQRISRQQQDAQEFLQVVAERLCDEYHAGRRARRLARLQTAMVADAEQRGSPSPETLRPAIADVALTSAVNVTDAAASSAASTRSTNIEEDEGFPLEGRFESQIECLTCGFKPKPTESTFCTLTLNVPQASSTTLNACFDGMFKTEFIDDFKCEKCRLLHAVEVHARRCATGTEASQEEARLAIAKLQLAIETNPEKIPKGVPLPDLSEAPKRRIARHIRLTHFPRVLAIHLSRSIYDASNLSQKNSAKVAFPERLPLGGLLNQKKYRLRGLVTHKGSHHSGHYETFRRQDVPPPFSNPSTFQPSEIFSNPAVASSTRHLAVPEHRSEASSPLTSVPDLIATGSGTDSSVLSLDTPAPPRDLPSPTSKPMPMTPSSEPQTSSPETRSKGVAADHKRKKRQQQDRWWRISDEKVKQASTSDVLGMQREVYLLFYELDREYR